MILARLSEVPSQKMHLTLFMLTLDLSHFENSVDPDQLASKRSQLIRIHTVFHSAP